MKKPRRLGEPARAVWKRVGDFGTLHTWHPAVAATKLEAGGTVRKLQLADCGVIVD